MSAEIRIGTSGWSYNHWIGRFYPERWPASRMFEYYRLRFDTVEVNNSFYHLPSIRALENWRNSAPETFRFAVKGSRFLTHMKKLRDPGPGIEKFFSRVDLLREKLGPILFQLPPNWAVNSERLKEFLVALPPEHRYAFEFRNPTWNTAEVFQLLIKYNAAYCPFHLAGYESPIEITADITYVRLHGPGGKYQGSYDDGALGAWARRIDAWRRDLKAIYFYFDNDDSGHAAENAARLREMAGLTAHGG